MYPSDNKIRQFLCPDCAGIWDGRTFTHNETCPASAALERACDSDREYFENNPGVDRYLREITRVEFEEFRRLGGLPRGVLIGQVLMQVTRIPGVGRTRQALVKR
jgi:hypothetical protein